MTALAITVIGFESGCRENKATARIHLTEESYLKMFLVVHNSPKKTLTIDGQVFYNVRGRSPCYLRTKNGDRIVFVTNERGPEVIHVYDLERRVHIPVSVFDTDFGYRIGDESPSARDEIVSETPDDITVSSTVAGVKKTMRLNLSDKKAYLRDGTQLP